MSEAPDTAMMSGSDDGQPGERLADPPLTAADDRVLQELRRTGPPVVEAREDRPETAEAVQDDTALPPTAPSGPGPLEPVFRQPPDADAG